MAAPAAANRAANPVEEAVFTGLDLSGFDVSGFCSVEAAGFSSAGFYSVGSVLSAGFSTFTREAFRSVISLRAASRSVCVASVSFRISLAF